MREPRQRPARYVEDAATTPEASADYVEAEAAERVVTGGAGLSVEHIKHDALRNRPPRGTPAVVVRRPHIAATLQTVENVLWAELKRLEQKTGNGQALDEEELRRFIKLSEVALKKVKEEREQEKHETEAVGGLTDSELLAALPPHIRAMLQAYLEQK